MYVSLLQRFDQLRTLSSQGRLLVGQRSLYVEPSGEVVWGIDEYGCDQIVAQTQIELDWTERALDWINQSRGPDLVDPAEFLYR